jgi:hypothetical protein
MINVSKGYSIFTSEGVMKLEAKQAVLKKFGFPQTNLRNVVIGRGISHILGAKPTLVRRDASVPDLPADIKKQLLDLMNSPETLLWLLTHPKISEQARHIRQGYSDIVKKMEEIRTKNAFIKDNNLRYRVCMADFLINVIGKWLADIIIELNLPKESIISPKPTRAEIDELFQSMPTSYCLFTLSQRRDQSMERPIEENDLNDIWALSMAIPYCDIVVADSMFATIARHAKLDKLYNTLILSSAEKLKGYL